jgi:multiple sugar transport system substrate-binding protein/putative aldouronate transport system substrate-binding protein
MLNFKLQSYGCKNFLMEKKMIRKSFWVLLLVIGIVFVSCNQNQSNNSPYRNRITVDYYHETQNFMGMSEGLEKKLLNEKFNMDINYIAPNIAGEQIYQTRSAAGNLGDLLMIRGDRQRDIYMAGLVMDITDLLQSNAPDLIKDKAKIDLLNTRIGAPAGRSYYIPTDMSSYSATEIFPTMDGAMLSLQEGAAPTIRWDAYKAVGMPPINTMEDLLPALKLMQDYVKVSDSGKPVYGFTIFNDWDDQVMRTATWFVEVYGYLMIRGCSAVFTWVGSDEVRTQRVDDDNGLYLRNLKFFFDANQMGLLDPDSPTHTWGDVWDKSVDGQTLMSGWTWTGLSPYNRAERGNGSPPKGFEFIPIPDADYYAISFNPAGQGDGLAIGAKARDPQRLMDFINWTGTPEGMQFRTFGPQGLAWDIRDGSGYITDFGIQILTDDTGVMVPAQYGGGPWGLPGWATPYHTWDVNPLTGHRYVRYLWPQWTDNALQEIDRIWQRDMGAEHALDYLKKHNLYTGLVGTNYLKPDDSMDIQTARQTCKMIVRNASWRMVFASNLTEFYSIWNQMKADIRSAGWEDIVRFDLQIAAEAVAARQAMLRSLR